MPGTHKQEQQQQQSGSDMILENDFDGGKENDDERNVIKTTKKNASRGGRSSKRGKAVEEEEEVFEEEEEEEEMGIEKEDVFLSEDDVEKKGNNNNGEKSKNKPPKNPPKSLDALKARLEATKSKVSSKNNKERESDTLGFIGGKETTGVPPPPGALLGGNDTTMNFGNATNAMDTMNIIMDTTNNVTTTTTTTNTGEMLVDNNSPATTAALDVPKIEVPEINIEALAAKHFDSALEEEISHSLNWKSIAPSHDFKNLVKERNNAISDFKKILPEVMRKKDRLVEDTVRATRGFQETVSTLQEHTARAAAQVQSARNEAKLAEQKLKSAKAEFVAREAKMLSNFSQNEEHKQQENETLRNELVEQSVQLQQKQKLLDQAEKKLKSFEKNSEKDSEQVLKLRDENIELEKQLAALKAENKEKEKAFASQSKTLEGQLKKQEADFEAKLASTEAAKVTSDQLAREMTAEKEASMVKLEVAEKEIAKLSESSGATNAALTEQNAKLEESLEKAEKELKKKEKELDHSSKHADKKLEGLNAEIAELQTLREQAVELEASLKTNCAELEKEKAVLEKKITSLEKDGDKKLSKIEKLEESIERVTGELKDTKSEFKTAESARKELSEQLVALQSKLNLESKSTELELANAHKEVKRYEDDLADAKAQAKSLIEQQGEMMGELKCARAELARLETERRDFEKNGSQTLQEAQEKCRADLKAQEKEFQKELKQERKQYDEKMEAERVKASESIEASRVENEKRINVEIKNTEKLSAQIEKLEKKLSKLEEAKKARDTVVAVVEDAATISRHAQELNTLETQLRMMPGGMTSGREAEIRSITAIAGDLDVEQANRENKENQLKVLRRKKERTDNELAQLDRNWRDAKDALADAERNQLKTISLREEKKKLERDQDQATRDIETLERELPPLEDEKKKLEREREERVKIEKDNEDAVDDKTRTLQKSIDFFDSLNDPIQKYIESNARQTLREIQKSFESADVKIDATLKKLATKQKEYKSKEKSVNKQSEIQRTLEDNIALQRGKKEEKELEMRIKELQETASKFGNVKDLGEELKRREKVYNQLEVTKAEAAGQVKTHREMARSSEKELNSAEYKNIDSRLSKETIRFQTLEMVNSDLNRYYTALDKALMAFHSSKMGDINKVVKELWQRTYRGQDIDYIQIRSDAEKQEGKSGGKSSYNYRVVMICNGAELDMRGRCSAGQKVLACLIIRLALAETFCLNCGILALDEPTTNLDTPNAESLARSLIDIMHSRREQENFQLIVITHDVEFAHMLGQRQQADYYWRVTKDENQHSCVEREDIYE